MGPEPLKQGLEAIRALLNSLDGQEITSVAITDIMNFIGKFVVSGNVRRGAEIAIGEEDDLDFIQMKDPERFSKELGDRRWASNNSIFVTAESSFCTAVQVHRQERRARADLSQQRTPLRSLQGWLPSCR